MKPELETNNPQRESALPSATLLERIADNTDLLEVGRKAVEDTLVEWRDRRISEFTRGNGLVIRERNGDESSIIRMGSEVAVKIALKAIAAHLRSNERS